jgi:hypothetical protein
MRFVSTALVMMALALMLLALMLLTPTVRANPMTFVAKRTLLGMSHLPTIRKRQESRTDCLRDIHHHCEFWRLILNTNIYVRDASSGATIAAMSADMRGNADETWSRTLHNRLLAPDYGLQR